jgi:zinc protease
MPTTRVEAKTLPNGQPMTQYRLDNGLDLYVIENHSAPVFTYQSWFRVGSKDEKLDSKIQATGLAHLFEHMMFRGTSTHPDGEFDEILTENGVNDENATTWYDRTNYYQSLPADRLELAMQLESDRMVNLVIDDNLLETEKGAVLGELHQGFDEPDSVAYDKLFEVAFTTHPYRYTTIGTESEIKAFTPESARYFYKKYYSPGNCFLIVAGDVKPENVLALLEKYYGAIPRQKIERVVAPAEPPQKKELKVQFEHPQLQQLKVLIGYRTPEVTHEDFPALRVLESLLMRGQGALLNLMWVNRGIAVEVGGEMTRFRDPGLFVIGTDLQEGHSIDELRASLDGEVRDFLSGDPKRLEFSRAVERARNQLLLGICLNWNENSALASFMGEYEIAAGDLCFGFKLVEALKKVTGADVARVAKKYLTKENRTIVVGSPLQGGGS